MTTWVRPGWRNGRTVCLPGILMQPDRECGTSWTPWAVALVCAPMLLLLVVVIGGATRDTLRATANAASVPVTAQHERSVLLGWLATGAVACVVNGAGLAALIILMRRQRRLTHQLRSQSAQRTRELSQIGSGLAHEVRNPLHALRINLHTLRRVMAGRSALPPDQLAATIDESDASIDRLDELMRDLLQYSDRRAGETTPVDLVQEIRAMLKLLGEDFRRAQLSVQEQLPAEEIQVLIDPLRLRQALLNLLTYAQHRAGKSGSIEVLMERREAGVELAVKNSGPLLGEKQHQQLFEPFQAPAETGSGLGLALVQAFVEEVGGKATCDREGPTQGVCRLWFPLEAVVSAGR